MDGINLSTNSTQLQVTQRVDNQEHLKSSFANRIRKCTICDQSFTLQASLKRHQRIHAGEKPYSCTTCDKSFAREDNLTEHQRTHTGERPYSCPPCQNFFAKKTNLIRHLQSMKHQRRVMHRGKKSLKNSSVINALKGEISTNRHINKAHKEQASVSTSRDSLFSTSVFPNDLEGETPTIDSVSRQQETTNALPQNIDTCTKSNYFPASDTATTSTAQNNEVSQKILSLKEKRTREIEKHQEFERMEKLNKELEEYMGMVVRFRH